MRAVRWDKPGSHIIMNNAMKLKPGVTNKDLKNAPAWQKRWLAGNILQEHADRRVFPFDLLQIGNGPKKVTENTKTTLKRILRHMNVNDVRHEWLFVRGTYHPHPLYDLVHEEYTKKMNQKRKS